jgi:hypothetical protein
MVLDEFLNVSLENAHSSLDFVGQCVDVRRPRRWLLISSLPHRRRVEQVSIQGCETTVLSAVLPVVDHLPGTPTRLIMLTKHFTGRDLGFYSYLDKRDPTNPSRRHVIFLWRQVIFLGRE